MKWPHPVHIDVLDIMPKEFTLSIRAKVYNVWRLRLGLLLLRASCRVLRCSVKVEDETEGDNGR